MTVQEILNVLKDKYSAILAGKLSGIYVHGSLAFGCFNPESSDIDFLAVVSSPLTQAEKEALIEVLLELNEYAPPKGFEMSVILESVCSPFIYPTPYELHFSNSYLQGFKSDLSEQCGRLHGVDKDLAAHITVTRAVGIPLFGKPISEVFAPVPREYYLDSLMYDIGSASAEICDAPVYYILNLCRVLAYLTDGCVLSKQQGGEWGIAQLPRYAALIGLALGAYSAGAAFSASDDALAEFAEDMLRRISTMNNWPVIKELTDKNVLGTEGLSAAPPRRTARAIVINGDGAYAVMYAEKFGLYSLPGGGMEENESPETALRREILEETGCSCDSITPLGIITENRFHADYTAVSYYFVVKSSDKNTVPEFTEAELENGTQLKWCSFDEALRLITDREHDTSQRKFLQARDIAALAEYKARFL